MDQSQFQYYRSNLEYTKFLEQGEIGGFKLYIDEIIRLTKPRMKVLDVGCGTGIVVNDLSEKKRDAYGVEISRPSVELAKKKRVGRYFWYDGTKLPFKSNFFDLVGSFNVIEHVDDVILFLDESLRVLKPGGYLIVCAPNFLSITSSYHYRTSGIIRKIKNLGIIFFKILNYFFSNDVTFEKFPPVRRENFQPDDDAVNLINPVDLAKWAKMKKLKVVKYWGTVMEGYLSYRLKNFPIINLITGGVFFVFKKYK